MNKLRLAIAVVIALGSRSSFAADKGPNPSPLERLVEAWTERSERILAASIRWEGQFTTPKSLARSEKVVSRCVKELRWVGWEPRKYYDYQDCPSRTMHSVERLEPTVRKRVFDGKEFREHTNFTSAGYSEGQVIRRPVEFLRRLWHYPIIINFRGLTPAMGGLTQEQIRLTDRTASLNGAKCIMFNVRKNAEMWVCPEQDYSVKMYVRYSEGEVKDRFTIEHKRDPEFGWVPSSWTIESLGRDLSPLHTLRETVTQYKFNRFARGDFQIEFPPGTLVTDDTDDADRQHGMVAADGRSWELMDARQFKTKYFELTQPLRQPMP